jgi:hypothetical protein
MVGVGTTGGTSMIMAYTQLEYDAARDQARIYLSKLTEQVVSNTELKEEIEILRAERSHWYHMYNNNVDERPDI